MRSLTSFGQISKLKQPYTLLTLQDCQERKQHQLESIEQNAWEEVQHQSSPVSHYRTKYYESLDCIINAIEDRFHQEDFKTYIKLENLLLKAAKGSDFGSKYKDVMALYDSDLDGIRCHVQLKTLSEYCKEIVDTGSVHTVTEVLRNLEVRYHLCKVYKLAKLIMVMPATNFTSKRTLNLLKLIKTYLWPTMT